jgi:hypothetical protein
VGFANLANIVSTRWHKIDPVYKQQLEEEARLDKIRYRREVRDWEAKLHEQAKEEADDYDEVDDLEDENEDGASSSREASQVISLPNQGYGWGGNMQQHYFPYLQHSFTPSQFNPSVFNPSFTPNYVVGAEAAASFVALPFSVERNPNHPWGEPSAFSQQGSLLFQNNFTNHVMPMHPSFQLEGRRNSMPDSIPSQRDADPIMSNFNTFRRHRRASLFESVRESEDPVVIIPPMEEIQRFFNINPETNKVETPKECEAYYCG